MNKKRRSDQARQEEMEKTMFGTFTNAANSLSQLYTQVFNYQKMTFKTGQQHGLEKVREWILKQLGEGVQVTQEEIIAYLQNELNAGEAIPMPSVYQPEQANSSGAQIPHGTIEGTVALSDQNRNTIFLNALSSPIRGSLQQPFHMAHGGNSSNSRGSSNEDSPSRGTGKDLNAMEE
ncbi:hypothetical protein QJS04_geneDACA009475 [Acorus gramineus]|uniref:Uncharacterized protein n=1 Tax=Acorus gramineus TaxID=55184 RepID=A0AAV9AID6_ACOGR|nr:hypothetical protein QJS04_geneDACA009475 [Acorus gramineus]